MVRSRVNYHRVGEGCVSKRVIFKGEGKVGIGVHRRGHKGECQGLDTMDGGTPKEGEIKSKRWNPGGGVEPS